ncbi:hypothetical protein OG21DRAFT_1501476 [Imleria badia]|nr:hypothetical protein OG21DRAFT_1501476 [Imleria badia]
MPDYVDKSRVSIASGYEDHDDEPMYPMVPRSLEILNAAVHLIVSRFLPDLFQLLQSLQREVRPSRRKRLIWPSSWYRLPGRGAARTALLRPHGRSKVQDVIHQTFLHNRRPRSSAEHVLTLQLSALIDADLTNTALLEDPWTLLFNAQVYLENMVLRELLPRYGIVFLPLDVPWVEDAQARGHGYGYYSHGAIDVDLERAMAIGDAFLRGLDYVLRSLD